MDNSVQRSRKRSRSSSPRDLELLLREIEKESVPDRLMQLALQLQAALADRRRNEEKDTARPNGSRRATQSRT